MRANRYALLLSAIAAATPALAVDYNWNGGTGAWNLAANWTPNGIPNALTDTALIDDVTASPAIVNLPGSVTITIGSGTLAANTNGGTNQIIVPNNTDFIIGQSFVNHGLISLNASGSLTHIYFRDAGSSLTGTGTLRMTGNNARIGAGVAGAGLSNGVGHTIAGFGNLGINTLSLANLGSILADVSGQTLNVDPTTLSNAGTMAASNGGTLSLFGGTYTNTGSISAGIGSTVALQSGVALSGGQLGSVGTGSVQVITGATIDLSSVTLSGLINVQNNADLRVQNTIANNGTVAISAAGSLTALLQTANTTLSGNGDVKLAGNNARIAGAFTLTNAATHLIHGFGNVGVDQAALINNGVIRADISGQTLNIDPGNLNIDAGGSDLINNGQMIADAGAILVLHGADYTNAGTLSADGADARVRLNDGARIKGGIVRGINGGKVVGVTGQNVGLQDLTVQGVLEMENNTDLELRGTITNNGTITILGAGSLTDAELNSPVTLSGTGTLRLAGSQNAGINTLGGIWTLTNGTQHTLAGFGRFGQDVTGFINDGTILADVAASTLTVDPGNADVDGAGADLLNRSVMRATAGGNLGLFNGDYANTAAGVIEASGAGSTVTLNANARITGGKIRGVSDGVVQIAASIDAGLKDLTIEGNLAVSNNADLELRGTITNNGLITVNAAGSQTDLELNSDVTLQGSGQLNLAGGSALSGINGIAGAVLTHANGHTLRGHGRFGQNVIGIINNGLINADASGTALQLDPGDLALDADGSDLLNNATLRSSSGGSLSLLAGDYKQGAAGVVEAIGAGSTVVFNEGARLTGGILRGTGGGVVSIATGVNAGLKDLTVQGALVATNNTDLELRGTITNSGIVTVNASGSLTDLELNSDVTLAGLGRVELAGSANAGINGAGGPWTLTNSAGHTIAGLGRLGQNTIRIVNNGVIQADVNGQTLTIDPSATVGGNYGFVNNNTLAAINGGKLVLTGGDFFNNGLVRVDPGASLNISSSANFIQGPGSQLIQSGDVVIESGGTFTNAGIFSPANVGTNGQVTMTGAFVNAPTGRLIIDIAGTTPVTQHDQIVGSGTTQLAGILEINRLGGFEPALYGTPIVFIRDTSGSGITGRFSQILNFDLGPNKKLAVIYSPIGAANANEVRIVAALPGDANVNGTVDFDDLLALAQNYNSPATTSWQQGDFGGNGSTTFDDLLVLAQNYGSSALTMPMEGFDAAFAADWALARSLVPEPTSLSILGLAMLIRRRR